VPRTVVWRSDLKRYYLVVSAVDRLKDMKHLVSRCHNPLSRVLPQSLPAPNYDRLCPFEGEGGRQVGRERSSPRLYPVLSHTECARIRESGQFSPECDSYSCCSPTKIIGGRMPDAPG
jgi:hypothetical protein